MRASILLLAMLAALSGCSPFYVMRAAYEEGKILANREQISDILADTTRPEEERRKLATVLEARDFAKSLGLVPGDSFTKYTKVDRDVLAWVLVGSKPDSFKLKTWWFPIVGRVPYKGFFSEEDALSASEQLTSEGFETYMRGTGAMSTLGWFNDPVLSTTLKHHDFRIVNTVIHEILHNTVWIQDHVDFNESLANYVGDRGMIEFYHARLNRCTAVAGQPCDEEKKAAALACADYRADLNIARIVTALYEELDRLYRSESPRETILAERVKIFDRYHAELAALYPRLEILTKVNNAELIQLKLYMTHLDDFDMLFRGGGSNWNEFLAKMKEISDNTGKDGVPPPFEVLRNLVAGAPAPAGTDICA